MRLSVEDRLKALRHALENWPCGAVVYHRTDGQRGLVMEHVVEMAGNVQVGVLFSHSSNALRCHVEELSSTPVGSGEAGDEWKDDLEGTQR